MWDSFILTTGGYSCTRQQALGVYWVSQPGLSFSAICDIFLCNQDASRLLEFWSYIIYHAVVRPAYLDQHLIPTPVWTSGRPHNSLLLVDRIHSTMSLDLPRTGFLGSKTLAMRTRLRNILRATHKPTSDLKNESSTAVRNSFRIFGVTWSMV
jgi:hypothetical protein